MFKSMINKCLTSQCTIGWNLSGKKTILVLGFLLITAPCVAVTLPIIQGFNAATIPTGWSETVVTDPDGDARFLYVTYSTGPSCTPVEGTHMVKFNSYSCDNGDELRLESPEFSTIGAIAPRVWFSWYESHLYSSYLDEGVTVQWSLDGSVWNDGTFYQRVNATNGWYDKTYILPAGALGQSSVYVGFLFHSHNGENCYLDDVIIAETTNPVFSVDPALKNYGTVNVGTSSAAQTFTIKNTGCGTLTIDPAISITGTDVAQFNLTDTNTYPANLTSGQSMTVDVTFSPTSQGVKTANLHIVDNLSRTAHDVALSGGGGDALDFDGTNDYVEIADNSSLDLTTNYSIEVWIKPESFSWIAGIVTKYHTASSNGYLLRLHKDDPYTGLCFDDMYTSTGIMEQSNWYHIAAVNDNGTRKLYLNGELQNLTGTPLSVEVNTDPVCLGVDFLDVGRYFNGDMDEVRIWNDVRTEAEIRANMCKKLTGNESGLVAYYKMTDGYGNSLTDNSTNSNTGTLTNMYNSDWVTSGAALRDASTYDYSTPVSVNFFSSFGDDVTVGTIAGSPSGVQIYRVDSAPNVTTPPAGLDQLSQSHYFGVFIAGGTSPTYTLIYNYDGHPGISNENNLELASRSNNAATSWTDLNATLNTSANTLTKPGQTGTEYILASTGGNSLPVTLSSFTAQFLNNVPTLYWITQSETDNVGWLVYRNEENDFTKSEKISELIEGHGTTTQQQSYIYEDNIENPEVEGTYYYWLESIDYSGMVHHYDKVAQLTIPHQDDPGSGLIPEPVYYGLFQNEPNPVISSTKISFNLHETAKVELSIYNLKGQLVKSLYSGVTSSKILDWDGKDESGKELSSGIYLYKLLVNGKTAETKKLIILK